MKKSTTNIETRSPKETQKVAQEFVEQLLEKQPRAGRAVVIALQGELGSGKTTFIQGIARGLGVKEKVLSPTFVIVKTYLLPRAICGIRNLYHIDCYRLRSAKELRELGWDSIVSDARNLILVEWPERIKRILPKDTISISFETTKQSERRIAFLIEGLKVNGLSQAHFTIKKEERAMVLRFYRTPAVSKSAEGRILTATGKRLVRQLKSLRTEFCFTVDVASELSAEELVVLQWLLAETFEPHNFAVTSFLADCITVLEVGPRLTFETPFSSNAVAICHKCGLAKVRRLERSVR